MKWVRRIVLLLLSVVIISLFTGYRLLHRQPSWYHPRLADAQQQENMARQVEGKLADATSWSQSAWLFHQHPESASPPEPFELSLSEDQINGFVSKWDQLDALGSGWSNALSDPQIEIDNGQLIVAATMKQTSTVLSIHLLPSIDARGQLHLDVDKVLGGQLPLPKAVWSQYASRVSQKISVELPAAESAATMLPDGSANGAMVRVVLGKLMLNLLAGEPGDPVVFLECPVENQLRNWPVKITGESIDDKTLKLRFEPLGKGERVEQ